MSVSEKNITAERLELKPEWVESSGSEKEDLLKQLILFFLGGFIILLFLGGGLGEILATILSIWIGLFVIFAATRKAKQLSPWKRTKNIEKTHNLPLKRTSNTTERAMKGFKLSQMLIEKRLRKAFIEKIKEEKSLSENDLKRLIENPSDLEKIIKDEELFNFVMNSKTIEDLSQKNSKSFLSKVKESLRYNKKGDEKGKRDESFEKKMKEIIKRISNWERG